MSNILDTTINKYNKIYAPSIQNEQVYKKIHAVRLHIWKREQKKNALFTIRCEELVGNKVTGNQSI